MTKILSLFNEKGGVGKTTQAVHIAAGLARLGHTVLLVDSDAQGHCSVHLNMPKRDSFYQVMANDAPFDESTLLIVPPDRYLAPDETTDGLFALLPGNDATRGVQYIITDPFMLEYRRDELEDVFDYVIMDMSPSISMLHTAILIASDAVLWVTKPAALDMDGLNDSIKHYDQTNKARVRAGILELNMIGVVPMMYEGYAVTGDGSDDGNSPGMRGTRANNAAIAQLTSRFKSSVWPAVPHRTVWQQAAFKRQTLFAYRRDCEESYYEMELVKRVEKRL